MADFFTQLKDADLISIGTDYNYTRNQFTFSRLFSQSKTNNMKIELMRLMENGDLPVMAQVHAFDSEARIGERPNFEVLNWEKLLIKEKLPTSERMSQYLSDSGSQNDIDNFIFGDASTLINRVLVRAEVMNGEILSTGKISINENNTKAVVEYGMKAENRLVWNGWSDPKHDILGDIKALKLFANSKGIPIVRALTSTKIIGWMMQNEGIAKFWANKPDPLTESALMNWLVANYGIRFDVNDEVYMTSPLATTTHRYFDEDTITFLPTLGTVGRGIWGVTPEERELTNQFIAQMYVTVSQWKTPDPVAVWTKATGIYLPVIPEINKMFISKLGA